MAAPRLSQLAQTESAFLLFRAQNTVPIESRRVKGKRFVRIKFVVPFRNQNIDDDVCLAKE